MMSPNANGGQECPKSESCTVAPTVLIDKRYFCVSKAVGHKRVNFKNLQKTARKVNQQSAETNDATVCSNHLLTVNHHIV